MDGKHYFCNEKLLLSATSMMATQLLKYYILFYCFTCSRLTNFQAAFLCF